MSNGLKIIILFDVGDDDNLFFLQGIMSPVMAFGIELSLLLDLISIQVFNIL